ncbi:MAG: RimJ/RimL family protein N-acetyltransferase [Planctomycetota bacterium]
MEQLPELLPDSALEIHTARLSQLPLLRTHAATLFPILSAAELYEFTGGSPPETVEALSEVYGSRQSRRSPDGNQLWLNWLVRVTKGGHGIGYTQATVHPTHAYVAWVIGTQWQGLGYASESAAGLVQMLGRLGVAEIRACVHPSHKASRRVAEKAGLCLINDRVDGEEVWAMRV